MKLYNKKAEKSEFIGDLAPTPITTSVPYTVWRDCKKNSWSWKDVFMTGYRVKISEDDKDRQIMMLEAKMRAMERKMNDKVSHRQLKRYSGESLL